MCLRINFWYENIIYTFTIYVILTDIYDDK